MTRLDNPFKKAFLKTTKIDDYYGIGPANLFDPASLSSLPSRNVRSCHDISPLHNLPHHWNEEFASL